MAKFDGTSLLFDWYLGASSFEEAGFNLSKSYASIERDSSNSLAIKEAAIFGGMTTGLSPHTSWTEAMWSQVK